MTWLAHRDDGGTAGFKVRYPDDNTVKWDSINRNPAGRVVFQMEGENTRIR
jgi:hypothetical protein